MLFIALTQATSSLDTETEQSIQDSVHSLGDHSRGKERTVIIVAHRLSTVQNADLIIVMEQGKVVEQGTHTELLERGGRYAELVMKMQQN
jgi:ABC-type multidrug transport system fused ATPase/permease subunit